MAAWRHQLNISNISEANGSSNHHGISNQHHDVIIGVAYRQRRAKASA